MSDRTTAEFVEVLRGMIPGTLVEIADERQEAADRLAELDARLTEARRWVKP